MGLQLQKESRVRLTMETKYQHITIKAIVFDNWKDGTIQVVVCTKAFGIVRVGCLQSSEDIIQKFGRVGQDGRPARSAYW